MCIAYYSNTFTLSTRIELDIVFSLCVCSTVDTYLLGSDDLLVFEILVANYGEDAFDSAFIMNVPHELDLKKTEILGEDTPITCSAPSDENNNILDCRIGNPLPSGKFVSYLATSPTTCRCTKL